MMTGRQPDAGRVLSSVTLFMWLPDPRGGGSNHSQRNGFTGTGADGSYTDMSGVKQFFGDGSVPLEGSRPVQHSGEVHRGVVGALTASRRAMAKTSMNSEVRWHYSDALFPTHPAV